jgi:hypothetical protein
MPAKRMFLSHGLSQDPWNGTSCSELWLAEWVKSKIEEFSDHQISVLTSIDYKDHDDFVQKINHDIAGSDAVLCLFTCRHENRYGSQWFWATLAPARVRVLEPCSFGSKYWKNHQ